MCGINGIFAYADSAPPVDEAELLRTRESMAKRGPDGAGLWLSADRRIGLGHRRLAIIDLSEAGAQPMTSADGRYVVTFNGEIYNYRELRRELEASGYVFRSNSDTEVLLHLYDDRGVRMLDALRGMYAFGLWDARQRTLFLARDPFGIKPLYYSDAEGTLRFASQVKALRSGGAVRDTPEPAGSVGFMLWGFVPEPFTLYRGVFALPAGASLLVTPSGAQTPQRHFDVREVLVEAQEKSRPFRGDDRRALGELLRDSVRHHLVSDVPVGAFLSSGVDSTVLASLAAGEKRAAVRSLTLGFREYGGSVDDEVPIAERVAASLGTAHETHWIARADFDDQLQAILDGMDQPSTDGVNTFLICREARRAGIKVALSGLGGDELFGGYPSFRDVPRLARWLRPAALAPLAGKLARRVMQPLLSRLTSPKFASLFEYGGSYEGAYLLRRALYMPWELGQVLDPVAVHVGIERLATLRTLGALIGDVRETHARVAAMEISWYMRNQLLRDADWAGMAHSVEIRVPLVDAALFRALAPWLTSAQPPRKADAAAATAIPLRDEILGRPKTGFSVPVREWITGDRPTGRAMLRGLRGWARHVLPAPSQQFRVLALVTDAYGGNGGIAKFNRDLIAAIAASPGCAEIVVIPRVISREIEALPERARFVASAAAGKLRFVGRALGQAVDGPFDLVISAHINLAPLSVVLGRMLGARTWLTVYGVDAWSPHKSRLVRSSLGFVDLVVGISALTLQRFGDWARIDRGRMRLLPPAVDLARYSAGPKPRTLEAELGLANRKVLLTVGRLESEERYKGFDEVIEALPALAQKIPDIAYLICGEGPDRARLEAKARALGVAERIVFTGFVPEASKADYYRLADAYVMPSAGEGFGIVYLEALASGLPVLGSAIDGSREALLNGELGELVDPTDTGQVLGGIARTLSRPKRVPERLQHFSEQAFRERVQHIVDDAASHRAVVTAAQ